MKTRFRPEHGWTDDLWAPSSATRLMLWAVEDFRLVEFSSFELHRTRLLARALNTFTEPHFNQPLRRAANAAAAQAEASGFPLLFFDELFCEISIAAMLEAEYLFHRRF